MSDPEEEQEQQRRRPKVVDKRISARPPSEESPAPSAPDPGPGQSAMTGSTAGAQAAGAVDASGTEDPGPTFRSPPPEPERAATQAPPQEVWTPEQEEAARRMAEEMARVPALDWVANAATQLVNVAAVKIDTAQPADAQLAIDSLSALVDSLGPRLRELEQPLRQAVAQLQMMFAQSATGPRPPQG